MSYYNNPYSAYQGIRRRKKQRLFTKDIEQLLYSLGDGPPSYEQTVNSLEEILISFLGDVCHAASAYAKSQGNSRVRVDDLPYALRNDPFKLSRMEYIINQSQRIERARKMFETDDKNIVSSLGVLDNGGNDEENYEKENNGSRLHEKQPRKRRRKVTGNVTMKQREDSESDDS